MDSTAVTHLEVGEPQPRSVGSTERPDAAALGPSWATMKQAAQITGANLHTVRYWQRQGLIGAVLVRGPYGRPQWMVRLDDVSARATRARGDTRSYSGKSKLDRLIDAERRAAVAEFKVEELQQRLAALEATADETARAS